MRVEFLRAVEGGITRLRTKGGASASWLYDLINGYVRQDGSISSRPGTDNEITLPAGTKGLTAANGKLVVFSSSPKVAPAGVEVEVLRHPTEPSRQLAEIHFAGPFLGDSSGALLYVVAEFDNGDVFHYWQRNAGKTWEAHKAYTAGEVIAPSEPNGLMYVVRQLGQSAQKWAPSAVRNIGDRVEPTTSNGYTYQAIDMSGSPTTGAAVEPAWIAADGAEVIEYTMDGAAADSGSGGAVGGDPGTGTIIPPPSVVDRYSGGGGGGGTNWNTSAKEIQ